MNITGQQVAQKPSKVKPDYAYLGEVKMLPCVLCGRHGVDAHHCKDIPPHGEDGLYTRLPAAGRRSGDRDAIPLCPDHHRLYHLNKPEFHRRAGGPDYQFIATTRATISPQELDF